MTHEVGSWGYDVELEAKKREQTDFSLSLSLSLSLDRMHCMSLDEFTRESLCTRLRGADRRHSLVLNG